MHLDEPKGQHFVKAIYGIKFFIAQITTAKQLVNIFVDVTMG
jgi:hypothetical protein